MEDMGNTGGCGRVFVGDVGVGSIIWGMWGLYGGRGVMGYFMGDKNCGGCGDIGHKGAVGGHTGVWGYGVHMGGYRGCMGP